MANELSWESVLNFGPFQPLTANPAGGPNWRWREHQLGNLGIVSKKREWIKGWRRDSVSRALGVAYSGADELGARRLEHCGRSTQGRPNRLTRGAAVPYRSSRHRRLRLVPTHRGSRSPTPAFLPRFRRPRANGPRRRRYPAARY